MFNTDRTAEADGMGLDLTPFVDAASKSAEAYARTREADAKLKAAKQKPAPTIYNQTVAAPQRRMNWLAWALIGLGVVGTGYVVRKVWMGRRRRR